MEINACLHAYEGRLLSYSSKRGKLDIIILSIRVENMLYCCVWIRRVTWGNELQGGPSRCCAALGPLRLESPMLLAIAVEITTLYSVTVSLTVFRSNIIRCRCEHAQRPNGSISYKQILNMYKQICDVMKRGWECLRWWWLVRNDSLLFCVRVCRMKRVNALHADWLELCLM